ncbi:TerD family protein [Streptomyces oceani]|uniref:TerD-family protein n=1 Tax=Streptomyces oceani TaxID=1075402 RepID=A0A1E7KL02_9ACTN|nr:TerD family protein [Streptomyces oceani]OEV04712.1 TerD-family protein [Streptomyces oceani]
MSSLNKGIGKVLVTLKWDPSSFDEPDHDLDLVAGTFTADAPYGEPEYLVHFDSRSPDGTITLNRESKTGQGFGSDEMMTLEFDRLSETYGRVIVGVVIQQGEDRKTFGDVANTEVWISEEQQELCQSDFSEVAEATAATIGEFVRKETGEWEFQPYLRGFDADPETFGQTMGYAPA